MTDPDDTDPMCDATRADTDPGLGPTEDTVPGERGGAPEPASDEFWRWLPTMGLALRRRRELVERPASDGAAFAAYAGAARPAVAAQIARFDAKVRIASGLIEGEAQGSRDALTVVKPRRGRRWPAVVLGLAGIAAVSVTVVVVGSSQRPAWRQAHAASSGQAASASRKLPDLSADSARHASSPDLTEEPRSSGAVPTASASTPGAERTSPVPLGAPRQPERSTASTAAESSVRRGARPAASAAPLTKDQFFEVP